MSCVTLKIVGAGGSGLLSTGDILIECLIESGLFFCSDREFPSLIKGGASCYHISISTEPISSLSSTIDVMLAVDRVGSMEYIHELRDDGVLLFGDERFDKIPGFSDILEKKNITTVHIPEYETPKKFGGNELMSNMLLIGALWRLLEGDLSVLEAEVSDRFASKPVLLKIDLACIKHGYELGSNADRPDLSIISQATKKKGNHKGLDGNELVALSAVAHGVRNYYAYPMSPSSQILMHLSNWSKKTGMIVKQAEDEISVVQMAIGSMYAGSRALCATSGGGFDLMVESISLAGMIETPLVIVDVQRPGPATGLPTWSAQADLNMAIHSGHGEFARIVLSLSDHETIIERVGEAFDLAEKFQIPVIILSEKAIGESRIAVDVAHSKTVPVKRYLVEDKKALEKLVPKDRFRCTKNGVSKRWIPGSSDTWYYANGDEHREDGTLTEDGEEIKAMMDKRLAKIETVKKSIAKPRIFGPKKGADISFVGWGSTIGVMKDLISSELGIMNSELKVNYLHFDYVWPLETTVVEKFFAGNPNVHLIESNSTGQLGTLLEDKTDCEFTGKLLKYDGRRLYREDVNDYINSKLGIKN